MTETSSSHVQQYEQAQQQSHELSPPYVLALDIGTSSVRALLYDAIGNAVPHVLAQQTYNVTTSGDGEVSVDANLLVELVAKTIDQALTSAGPLATQIKAVATDTFWHSLVGIDASGQALMPVITWEDTRPRSAAAELRAQLDEDAVHKRTGARIHASYWPAKLRWLSTLQPELFERTTEWLSFGEYLHRTFLGRSVCSLSMASGTGMLVTRTRSWDAKLQEVLGVRAEQLPPLGDLDDSIAGLKTEFASRWPVLHAIPWFPALGDGAAANVGSGCANGANWAITIGTSSAIRVVVPPDVTPSNGLWLYRIDERRGLLGGALSEGGNVFAWLESTLKLPPLVEAESLIAALPPDGHGLTLLPFVSGERSPGWHDAATMTISGISSHTSSAELLRASLEALAYQLREVYDQLLLLLERQEIAPTLIGSGGALLSSRTLQGIIADTLNASLYPSLQREASARGAALLALESLGIIPDVAHTSVEQGAPVLPDVSHHAIYEDGIRRQQRLYEAILGK